MDPETVTEAYNDACRAGPELMAAVAAVERSEWLRHNDHQCTLARPLFVDEREIRTFTDDLGRLLGLLAEVPDRLFDGDPDRFAAAVGIDPARARLMTRLGGKAGQLVGRADVHHDGTSFRMLEFGVGSELGGWGFGGEVPKALVRDEAFGEFVAAHELGIVDTGQLLVDALRDASVAAGLGKDPVVALVEAPGALARWGNTWRLHQDVMRELGLDFHVGDLMDVSVVDGVVRLAGMPVDVVYRCFEAGDLVGDAQALERAELLAAAHEDGRAVLWTPMDANLLGEKSCLALLSDPRWQAAATADERALVDRVLPWTRSLHPGLVEECRARRAELILKPNALYGGIGVIAGWDTGDREWADALTAGVRDGAIVQRRVRQRPEVVVDRTTGADTTWRTLWGIFYVPTGYAGARCWMVPDGGPSVVGIAQGKDVLAAGVFHTAP
jgi:hypothetical protein